MRFMFFLLLTVALSASCKKDQLSNPNEPLVGIWRHTQTSTENQGLTDIPKLKQETWRIYNNGTLKIFRNGILRRTETWQRDTISFLGAYDPSTGHFETILKPALRTSHMGTVVLNQSGDQFALITDYIDGANYYFERQ